MRKFFGTLASGEEAGLYTITGGRLKAVISDYGATIVRLYVPDQQGNLADVVQGFDDPMDYASSGTFFGAVVGRNANRINNGIFTLNGKTYHMEKNDGNNNHHSGPNYFKNRLWEVEEVTENSIRMYLFSPHGDQGFPGNAEIRVTYCLESNNSLLITFDAVCDQDTVFNLTNHSYFNLAGHDRPEAAMEQILCMPSRFFVPSDAQSIPLGQLRSVADTPMDFREPKMIGRDIGAEYDALQLQGGYDHSFEVFTDPCAILSDPVSGRTMAVSTDCYGVHFYSGNYTDEKNGKDGVRYASRSGVCLETQFYPDSVNNPQWPQPITRAGEHYRSWTRYAFE